MGLSYIDWVEIYVGTSYRDFLRKQTVLHSAGLKFKAKTRKGSLRFLGHVLDGGGKGLFGKKICIKDYYVILVKKADSVYAKNLLG